MGEDEKRLLYRLLQQWIDHPDDDVVLITELLQKTGSVPLIIARRSDWAYSVPGEKGYRITAKGIRALAAEKAAQS